MSAVAATRVPRVRLRWRPVTVVLYALLVLLALFYLLPLFAILVTALKSFAEVTRSSLWDFPRSPTVAGFKTAYDTLAPYFLASLELVVPATVLSALLGSLNGYVLSKWKFRGANIVFTLLLFGMFIPYQSILIPMFQFVSAIGLYGGIPGLILIHVVYGIPICTLIFRNYFAAVPTELVEAARIDGAGVLGIFLRIMLPISIPGFVVVMIWQFTSIWNEFLFAVTMTIPPSQPITVGLVGLTGGLLQHYEVQMAGALLAALPTLVVYVVLGRYFVRGLLAGSLKG